MKGTAWESLLLVEAEVSTLRLLKNTHLPFTTQTQNFAGENDQKELDEEMKENSSYQALPLIPTTARMTNTIATRNISFYLSSLIPRQVSEGQTDCPVDHDGCHQHRVEAAEKQTCLHESIRISRAGISFLSDCTSSLRTQRCPFG